MEPPSFDSSAETNVVRRFPTSTKVFVSAPAGNFTKDLLHVNLDVFVFHGAKLRGKGEAFFGNKFTIMKDNWIDCILERKEVGSRVL